METWNEEQLQLLRPGKKYTTRYNILKISGVKENDQTIMHQETKGIQEAEVGRLKSSKEAQQKKSVVQAK